MIVLIAWRNVWRNPTRSLVVIAAIAVGIWAIALAVGFINSMSGSFIRNAILYDYSHLQVHHRQFPQEPEVRYSLRHSSRIQDFLLQHPALKAMSPRILVHGMVASTRASSGVQIYGIDYQQEAALTSLDSLLQAGSYFSEKSRNAILISRKLAGKLKAVLRTKVVLTLPCMCASRT